MTSGVENNPFYILQIPLWAGYTEIAQAVEDRSRILDSQICKDARFLLINTSQRLQAELNWFFETDEDLLSAITECIREQKPLATEELSDISKLNAALYNYRFYRMGQECICQDFLEIAGLFSELNSQGLTTFLNQTRQKAHLPQTNESEVIRELGNKWDGILQMLHRELPDTQELSQNDTYQVLMDKCMEIGREQILAEERVAKDLICKDFNSKTGNEYASWICSLIARVQEWNLDPAYTRQQLEQICDEVKSAATEHFHVKRNNGCSVALLIQVMDALTAYPDLQAPLLQVKKELSKKETIYNSFHYRSELNTAMKGDSTSSGKIGQNLLVFSLFTWIGVILSVIGLVDLDDWMNSHTPY